MHLCEKTGTQRTTGGMVKLNASVAPLSARQETPHALVVASAYIFMLTMARCLTIARRIYMRSAKE